jgi:hypothetical protein
LETIFRELPDGSFPCLRHKRNSFRIDDEEQHSEKLYSFEQKLPTEPHMLEKAGKIRGFPILSRIFAA